VVNGVGELIKQSAVTRCKAPGSNLTAPQQLWRAAARGRLVPATMGIHILAWRCPAGEHGIDWAEQ
jgi:hypothetical protein